jgi:hypothetical protein
MILHPKSLDRRLLLPTALETMRTRALSPTETPLDLDAAAYAARVSLSPEPAVRLSGFLKDIKAAGITPLFLTLGRSEFLGRSGATHRAVIGPDATITGSLGNTSAGIVFDGDAGHIFEFNNPSAFTSGYIWQIAVVSANAGTSYNVLSGSVNSGGPFGPSLRVASGGVGSWGASAASPSTLRTRGHAYNGAESGFPLLIGSQFTGSFLQPIKDIYPEFAFSQSGAMWNNSTKWRIGANLSNAGRLVGSVSLAMAGTGVLSRAQLYHLAGAVVRNNLAGITPPTFLGFIGDSMTVSATGGINPANGRASLWVKNTSGWKGSFYDQEAVGGTAITGQEGFFATMMARMALVPDMPRTIVFWGGYNAIEPFGFATQAGARALADRYVAMAVTAQNAGISTVHWSRTRESDIADGSAVTANIDDFNNYYKTQIQALSGKHIFYDHRITYPGPGQGGAAGTHFDGPNRNATYFGDNIHCSQTGINTLVADFLTQYPNPP